MHRIRGPVLSSNGNRGLSDRNTPDSDCRRRDTVVVCNGSVTRIIAPCRPDPDIVGTSVGRFDRNRLRRSLHYFQVVRDVDPAGTVNRKPQRKALVPGIIHPETVGARAHDC